MIDDCPDMHYTRDLWCGRYVAPDQPPTDALAQQMHREVARHTRFVDIFDKSLLIWPIGPLRRMVIGFDCGIKSQLVRLNTNHGVLLTLYSFEDLGEHMMVVHIKTFLSIEFEKKHPGMERPNVESTPYISTTTDWWLKLRPIPPPECKDFAEQVMASLT